MIKKHKFKIVLATFLIVLLISAFYSGLIVRTYAITSNKLNEGSIIRIVLISDLHSYIFGSDQQPLIQKIIQQEPDLILLAGDIADDRRPNDGTWLLVDGIRDTAPIFYVAGNHEYFGDERFEMFRYELQSKGVRILSDEYEQIEVQGNTLIVAGIEDPDKQKYLVPDYDQAQSMQDNFTHLSDLTYYKILISHRPERIYQYLEYSFDLIVSGHAHGGQVRIPFILNGLYAPNQGWFPNYAGGLYRHGDVVHIVNRGLVIYPWIPRIFNPPEISVIIIESE